MNNKKKKSVFCCMVLVVCLIGNVALVSMPKQFEKEIEEYRKKEKQRYLNPLLLHIALLKKKIEMLDIFRYHLKALGNAAKKLYDPASTPFYNVRNKEENEYFDVVAKRGVAPEQHWLDVRRLAKKDRVQSMGIDAKAILPSGKMVIRSGDVEQKVEFNFPGGTFQDFERLAKKNQRNIYHIFSISRVPHSMFVLEAQKTGKQFQLDFSGSSKELLKTLGILKYEEVSEDNVEGKEDKRNFFDCFQDNGGASVALERLKDAFVLRGSGNMVLNCSPRFPGKTYSNWETLFRVEDMLSNVEKKEDHGSSNFLSSLSIAPKVVPKIIVKNLELRGEGLINLFPEDEISEEKTKNVEPLLSFSVVFEDDSESSVIYFNTRFMRLEKRVAEESKSKVVELRDMQIDKPFSIPEHENLVWSGKFEDIPQFQKDKKIIALKLRWNIKKMNQRIVVQSMNLIDFPKHEVIAEKSKDEDPRSLYNVLEAGEDAEVVLDGLSSKWSENKIKNLLPGVTVDLKKVSDTPHLIDLETNYSDIVETLEHFIQEYNNVMMFMNHTVSKPGNNIEREKISKRLRDYGIWQKHEAVFQTKSSEEQDYLRLSGKYYEGCFWMEYLLNNYRSRLRDAMVSTPYEIGEEKVIKFMYQIGVEDGDTEYLGSRRFGEGYLKLNKNKLMLELQNHFKDVKELFSNFSPGNKDGVPDRGVSVALVELTKQYTQKSYKNSKTEKAVVGWIESKKLFFEERLRRYQRTLMQREEYVDKKINKFAMDLRRMESIREDSERKQRHFNNLLKSKDD